jgi:hypothetical protein
MSNEITTFDPQGTLPDYIKTSLNAADIMDEMTSGVVTGFPVLSFRGKVWRVKKSGEEAPYIDENGDPRPSIELVMVQANRNVSKLYYPKGYEEGSTEAPACFSMDGKLPDPSAAEPQHASCATCPHNQWGSKVTPQGTKTKSCSDNRRMAVVSVNDLMTNGADANVMLMRVPGASLQNVKEYTERTLGSKGWPFCAVVTRFGFDPSAAFPKLTLRPSRPLTKEELSWVLQLREGDDAARILADHSDFVAPAEQDDTAPKLEPTTSAEVTAPAAPAVAEAAPAAPAEPPKAEEPAPSAPSKLDEVKSDVDALLGSL